MLAGKKVVEIKGIAFPNKGAELLLCACLQKLGMAGMYTATEPYSPYVYKLNYPLLQKSRIYFKGVNILYPLSLMPRYARERLGLVNANEVDLVLDASGYAYGDPWSPELAKARVLGESNKIPSVILPQSLGPFDKAVSKKTIRDIVRTCKHVYSREEVGAQAVFEETGFMPEVVPDITFCLDVESEKTKNSQYDVFLVPNWQVHKREGEDYIQLLVDIVKQLLNSGRRVDLFNHEGVKDLEICELVLQRLRKDEIEISCIEPKDGMEAKKMIRKARFVVSSRYHGIISSLSQSVPCFPIGWSFKYVEAMKLFGISVSDGLPDVDDVVGHVVSEGFNGYFASGEYADRLDGIKRQVDNMWKQVLPTNLV